MILRTEGLSKHFGGLTAVNRVNLQVEEGQITSIIGPNGAGKTTLFNMLTGELPVSEGNIFFQEKDVTRLQPHHIARERIGRSFQQNRLFGNLRVLENIRLAAHVHHRGNFNIMRHFLSFTEPTEKAWQVIEELGIKSIAAKQAAELPHGQQRILELAIALASDPLLILLDEPTSGMSPDDSIRMIQLLRKIATRLTMLIIEHNMNLVMSISSVITVLHQGTVIASGKPSEVQRDNTVRKAYLGGHVE